MLMTNFMAWSPVRTCISRQILYHSTHRIIVITTVVPTTIHITRRYTKRQTMYIVVVAIACSKFAIVSCILNHIIFIRIGRFLGLSLRDLLIKHTQQKAFPNHNVIPFSNNIFNSNLLEIVRQSFVGISILINSIMKRELQSDIFTQYCHRSLCGACLDIVPICICIGSIKFVTHLVPIAIDVTTLDMYLKGIIIRQFTRLSLMSFSL